MAKKVDLKKMFKGKESVGEELTVLQLKEKQKVGSHNG